MKINSIMFVVMCIVLCSCGGNGLCDDLLEGDSKLIIIPNKRWELSGTIESKIKDYPILDDINFENVGEVRGFGVTRVGVICRSKINFAELPKNINIKNSKDINWHLTINIDGFYNNYDKDFYGIFISAYLTNIKNQKMIELGDDIIYDIFSEKPIYSIVREINNFE